MISQSPPGPPINDPARVHPIHPIGVVPVSWPARGLDRAPDAVVYPGQLDRAGALRPQRLPVDRPHQDAPAASVSQDLLGRPPGRYQGVVVLSLPARHVSVDAGRAAKQRGQTHGEDQMPRHGAGIIAQGEAA